LNLSLSRFSPHCIYYVSWAPKNSQQLFTIPQTYMLPSRSFVLPVDWNSLPDLQSQGNSRNSSQFFCGKKPLLPQSSYITQNLFTIFLIFQSFAFFLSSFSRVYPFKASVNSNPPVFYSVQGSVLHVWILNKFHLSK
jgi:hypothetical protein